MSKYSLRGRTLATNSIFFPFAGFLDLRFRYASDSLGRTCRRAAHSGAGCRRRQKDGAALQRRRSGDGDPHLGTGWSASAKGRPGIHSREATCPRRTSTSYWPKGQVHKIARNTYDDNANFTGEFIQIFDESGKQIGGHRLTHDPQTGVYQCNEWNIAAQDYKAMECPAGEESSGTPEVAKKFTQDEVMQQLQRARQAASQEQKAGTTSATPAQSSPATNMKEVGLILPAQIRPGQRVSGSVVEDPSKYEGMPEVTVTRVTLPFQSSGAGSTLAGWVIEVSGEPPQAADGPIALTIPPGQARTGFRISSCWQPRRLDFQGYQSPHTALAQKGKLQPPTRRRRSA